MAFPDISLILWSFTVSTGLLRCKLHRSWASWPVWLEGGFAKLPVMGFQVQRQEEVGQQSHDMSRERTKYTHSHRYICTHMYINTQCASYQADCHTQITTPYEVDTWDSKCLELLADATLRTFYASLSATSAGTPKWISLGVRIFQLTVQPSSSSTSSPAGDVYIPHRTSRPTRAAVSDVTHKYTRMVGGRLAGRGVPCPWPRASFPKDTACAPATELSFCLVPGACFWEGRSQVVLEGQRKSR